MKKSITSLIAIAAMALATSAIAAKDSDGPAASCEGINIATGPAGKGYSKLFKDIKNACGAVVPVCEVNTTGGLDNLNSMSTKDADIGPAQLDTWQTMKSGDENIAGLQAVAGLNYNYLHAVVAANGYAVKGEKKWGGLKDGDVQQVVINRFSDLRGKTVALVGSAQLLGRQVNKNMGYNMQFVDIDSDDKAFAMVRQGQVAAAFSVSGWPHGTLRNLKQDSGLSLVPFDAQLGAGPYVVRPINYKGLGVFNNNALAVPNVLFTRPFKGEKATEVAKLRQCLEGKLSDMQEGAFEPAWNEIKSLSNTFEVPRFNAAAPAGAAPVAKKK